MVSSRLPFGALYEASEGDYYCYKEKEEKLIVKKKEIR